MKRFNNSIARIKDQNGNFIPLDAIRGENVYDLAVRYGYEGTEHDYFEAIVSGGWVDACTKLAVEKADKADVYTIDETDTKINTEVSTAFAEVCNIGDIKMKIGAAPNDTWLLCDGRKILKKDYPELCAMDGLDHGEYPLVVDGYSYGSIEDICFDGQMYVIQYNRNAGDGQCRIAKYSDLNNDVGTAVTTAKLTVDDSVWHVDDFILACSNDTWVAAASYSNQDSTGWIYRVSMLVSTDRGVSWTKHDMDRFVTNDINLAVLLNSIAYENGKWILTERNRDIIYYTESPTEEWTQISPIPGFIPNGITYHDGYWVAYNDSKLYTAQNIEGPWTENTTMSGCIFIQIKGNNGTWIGITNNKMYTTSDPTQSWSEVIIEDTVAFKHICIDTDGGWIIVCTNSDNTQTIFYTRSASQGTWNKTYISNTCSIDKVVCDNAGNWLGLHTGARLMSSTQMELPRINSISTNATINTYIKAKA